MFALMQLIEARVGSASPIGLDVGPRMLRAAQLERKGSVWTVTRVASWSRREAERGPNISDGFAGRIRAGLSEAGFQGRQLVTGFSLPDVECHAIDLPAEGFASESPSYRDALRFELRRVINSDQRSVNLDYWRLPPSKTAGATAVGVALPGAEVEAALELARSLRLVCEQVDFTACALSRLGALLRRDGGAASVPGGREVWGVLDLGRRAVRLIVAVDEIPVLVRRVCDGAEHWTELIAETLGLSAEAAETHKCDYGIEHAESDAHRDAGSEIAGLVRGALETELGDLQREIERSYEYVMRCYPNRPAAPLLLTGGGASLKGLDRFLAGKLGVPVVSLDEAVGAVNSPLENASGVSGSLNAFGCAIGLALPGEILR